MSLLFYSFLLDIKPIYLPQILEIKIVYLRFKINYDKTRIYLKNTVFAGRFPQKAAM